MRPKGSWVLELDNCSFPRSNKDLEKASSLKSRPFLWESSANFKVVPSLSFARNTRRFFLIFYYENLVMLLEANLWKCGVSLNTRHLGISTHSPIYTQPLAICQNDYLNFLVSLWLQRFMIPINWNWADSLFQLRFSVFSCISIFQDGALSCEFNSLLGLRNVIFFFSSVFFLCVLSMRVMISKLFTWSWNLKLSSFWSTFLLEIN